MPTPTRLFIVCLLLSVSAAAVAITNPNFAPEQTYAGAGDGNESAGPDGWVLRDGEGRAVVSTVDFALAGERVFWFETPERGFGDNKLDQCMEIDDLAFGLSFSTWSLVSDSNLRARVNVESYPGQTQCDTRNDRLDNEDFDFNLDGPAGQWQQHSLNLTLDNDATHVRISLRMRDRTDGGDPADPPIQVFFDGIEVTGATLVNGDFEDTTITEASFGQDQGPFGWTLRSVSDLGLVVPEPTAELGSAFQFSTLGTGYGNNTLEQCVDISGLDPFVFDVSVWPNLADSDLRVRLALDLYASESDCIDRTNGLSDPDFDFRTSDMVIENWNALRTGLIEPPAAADWARIALRARDQRGGGPDPIILFDRVALTDRFLVGGTVSGLASGAELTLDNNGEPLVIDANGSFVFPTALAHDAGYLVTVAAQPTAPSQTCTVSAGSGQIDADDVSDIAVECTTNTFAIGGEVAGLAAGNSVILQLNNDATVTVSANAGFTFPDALEDGSAYAVTVLENPTAPDQSCTVANGDGVLSGSNIDDVLVTCATNTFTVGGTLTNLVAGTTLVIQNNAVDDLTLTSDGPFTFSTEIADGAAYAVTVLSQPTGPNQICQISNADGVIAGADVDNVAINCQIESYPVGGTLSGLAAGATVGLDINGDETLNLNANGTFDFTTSLADGATYAVTVISQPTAFNQICSVSNGSGVIDGSDVTDVSVVCEADAATPGPVPGSIGRPAPIINPGFGLERAFAGDGEEFPGPEGWIMRDLEDRRGLVSTADFARSGQRVFRFESPQRGFGDNKLDQCLPLSDPTAFGLRLQAWSSLSHPEVQVRVNVESYPSAADCAGRDNRLDNLDFDFPLTAPPATWQALELAQSLDATADFARISIRMRDRSAAGDPAQPAITVLFDDISASGADIVNGNFETGSLDGALFGTDQGPLGWMLRSVSEFGMIVPEPSASGGSAFQFTQLGEGFGDNTLEQCVPIEMDRFVFSAAVWPELLSADLRIRLNVDLHANLQDCLNRNNRIARHDFDFRTSELNRASWNTIRSRAVFRPATAGYARLALRARDRVSPAPANPPIILFDQVSVAPEPVSVPVNHPLALLAMFLLILGLGARALNRLSRYSIT